MRSIGIAAAVITAALSLTGCWDEEVVSGAAVRDFASRGDELWLVFEKREKLDDGLRWTVQAIRVAPLPIGEPELIRIFEGPRPRNEDGASGTLEAVFGPDRRLWVAHWDGEIYDPASLSVRSTDGVWSEAGSAPVNVQAELGFDAGGELVIVASLERRNVVPVDGVLRIDAASDRVISEPLGRSLRTALVRPDGWWASSYAGNAVEHRAADGTWSLPMPLTGICAVEGSTSGESIASFDGPWVLSDGTAVIAFDDPRQDADYLAVSRDGAWSCARHDSFSALDAEVAQHLDYLPIFESGFVVTDALTGDDRFDATELLSRARNRELARTSNAWVSWSSTESSEPQLCIDVRVQQDDDTAIAMEGPVCL